jgi:HAE1 family hydrophobic/amphiphilic exporter-1
VSLPGFSVRRPVLTAMATLMVVLVGLVSYSRLQIDLLPDIEQPSVTVRADFDGASPEVMERSVTSMLEEIMATVPGVEEITSTSSEGSSSVRVSFGWGADLDAAAADVRATLENEINELPDDITRPRVRKFDVNSYPVVILGVSSDVDPVELTRLVEEELRYRLGRVPGVAQVDLWGGFRREIRVALDPGRLKALGLGLDEVVAAVGDANLELPAGRFVRDRYEVLLRAPAQYTSLEQIRGTAVARRGGAVITLGQLAEVSDTYERITEIERFNGQRGIRVAIRKQPGDNTVEVSRGVLEEVARINRDFPQLTVIAVSNQGNFIERSIDNVARSVLYGGGLAVAVLLFFLRSLRSTAVIALAIPVSVVATFALLQLGGFTLNLMTLGGLALGVGMMVDNAIVVLENIYRRREEEGEDPARAAVAGAGEVAGAIVASTITTLVIFLPVVFIEGVSGVLFQELAMVIVFSLLCSLAVSLSAVPALAARLLRPAPAAEEEQSAAAEQSALAAAAAARLAALSAGYQRLLARALAGRWRTVGLAAALLAGGLALVPLVGTELMPPSDEGEVRVSGELEPGTRLALVDRQTRRMAEIVSAAVPEVEASVVSAEDGEGSIQLTLVPAAERSRSNSEIAEDLRARLEGQLPGMDLRVSAPQGQRLLQRVLGGSEEGLTVEVRGFDLDAMDALARRVAAAVGEVEGVADVRVSRRAGRPQEELWVDREKAADLGFSPRDVAALLRTAMAGADAGEYREGGESYRVFVQLADAGSRTLEEILDLTLTAPGGQQVTLGGLVEPVDTRGPVEITRKDRQRLVTVTANLAGRDQGSVAADIQARLDALTRPEGVSLALSGSAEEQARAFRELLVSMLLAVALVYMVLASQYESLVDPLIVMLSIPVAAVGVPVTLLLTDTTFNLQSMIGCIMLGGIVVNNAILLVDQAGQLRARGMPVAEAVAEAGRRRLRPILMTTLTTILGLLPLALGIGEGADAQAPLARAVVGGLISSTAITLVLIPTVYTLVHRDRLPR